MPVPIPGTLRALESVRLDGISIRGVGAIQDMLVVGEPVPEASALVSSSI